MSKASLGSPIAKRIHRPVASAAGVPSGSDNVLDVFAQPIFYLSPHEMENSSLQPSLC